MLEWMLGKILSIVLGDLIGPGLVVAGLLGLSIYLAFIGMKTLAKVSVAAALLLGVFLAGAQFEKKEGQRRIDKLIAEKQEAEDLEKRRQESARLKIEELNRHNTKLRQDIEVERAKKAEVLTREIIKEKIVGDCRACAWSKSQHNRLQSIIKKRDSGSGN